MCIEAKFSYRSRLVIQKFSYYIRLVVPESGCIRWQLNCCSGSVQVTGVLINNQLANNM